MRSALIKILISFCLTLFYVKCYSQDSIVLPAVQMFPQQTGSWCWAASMEMIMEAHAPSVNRNQFELAKKYLELQGGGSMPPGFTDAGCKCNDRCDTTCINSGSYRGCNTPIPVYTNLKTAPIPQWFDLLFSAYNYNATEEVNRAVAGSIMTWNALKEQIKMCRPFILTLSPTSDQVNVLGHATVAKGYVQRVNTTTKDTLKFIVINNPWAKCGGGVEMLPYENFLASSGVVKQILASVHNIYQKTDSICTSCKGSNLLPQISRQIILNEDPIKIADPLVNQVNYYFGEFIGTIKRTFRNDEYLDIVSNRANYCAPLPQRFFNFLDEKGQVDFRKLTASDANELLSDSGRVSKIIYKIPSPRITTTIENFGNTRIVKDISLKSYPCQLPFEVEQPNKITIKGTLSNEPGGISFSLIDTYPLQFEFYRFQLKDQYYWTPVETYNNFFDASQPVEQGKAYTEKVILKNIKEIIKNEYSKPKKLFLNLGKLFGIKESDILSGKSF